MVVIITMITVGICSGLEGNSGVGHTFDSIFDFISLSEGILEVLDKLEG